MTSLQNMKLTEADYTSLSESMGSKKTLEMIKKVGFEPTVYFLVAKMRRIFIQRPSAELRYQLNIHRSTEWKYRKKLKDNNFL